MKFSTRQDIEAPVAHVFGALTDFDHFAGLLRRRGMRIDRTDDLPRIGPGTSWIAEVEVRGQMREVTSVVTAFVADAGFEVGSATTGLDCLTLIDLTALAAHRTRLHVSFEARPTTMKGRLLIQSLKLARSRLNDRFGSRVARLAQEVEDRYRA